MKINKVSLRFFKKYFLKYIQKQIENRNKNYPSKISLILIYLFTKLNILYSFNSSIGTLLLETKRSWERYYQ